MRKTYTGITATEARMVSFSSTLDPLDAISKADPEKTLQDLYTEIEEKIRAAARLGGASVEVDITGDPTEIASIERVLREHAGFYVQNISEVVDSLTEDPDTPEPLEETLAEDPMEVKKVRLKIEWT